MRARLRASTALGKITTIDHIWRKAPRNTCYNLGCFPGRWRRKRKMQGLGGWQVRLFTALATHVALSRKDLGLNFDKDELVVVVCAAIRRVVGPFQLFIDSLLLSG